MIEPKSQYRHRKSGLTLKVLNQSHMHPDHYVVGLECEGQVVMHCHIHEKDIHEDWIKKTESNEQKYLVKTTGFVGNSLLWWRDGRAGYTTDIDKSHVFDKEEAESIVKGTSGENEMYLLADMESIATRQIHSDHLYDLIKLRKEASNE